MHYQVQTVINSNTNIRPDGTFPAGFILSMDYIADETIAIFLLAVIFHTMLQIHIYSKICSNV